MTVVWYVHGGRTFMAGERGYHECWLVVVGMNKGRGWQSCDRVGSWSSAVEAAGVVGEGSIFVIFNSPRTCFGNSPQNNAVATIIRGQIWSRRRRWRIWWQGLWGATVPGGATLLEERGGDGFIFALPVWSAVVIMCLCRCISIKIYLLYADLLCKSWFIIVIVSKKQKLLGYCYRTKASIPLVKKNR